MDTKLTDWNVIVTVRDEGYRKTKRVLKDYGTTAQTSYYNVLVARVSNLADFLHDFTIDYRNHPFLQDAVSRIGPLQHTFTFSSAEDFEQKAKEVIRGWIMKMNGSTFHVRMHRRGHHELSTLKEEQAMDRFILEELFVQGLSGQIGFRDEDYIIEIETIDNQAGISLWSRADLINYPFLNLH